MQASSIQSLKDLQATAVDSILIPWFAFQNHSVLAAEALVETVVALYRSGWSVERVQMELSFLTLQRQREGIDQVQTIDSEMLLSFVLLIMITAKVSNINFRGRSVLHCSLVARNHSAPVAGATPVLLFGVVYAMHFLSSPSKARPPLIRISMRYNCQHAGSRVPSVPLCLVGGGGRSDFK